MATRDFHGPHNADDTLRDLDQSRQRLAERMTAPWWYRLGAAWCTLLIFVGMGMMIGDDEAGFGGDASATALIVLGALVGPPALLTLLKRRTGVSVDRYRHGLGVWYAIVFGLLVIGFALQMWVGLSGALAVAGALAFVATLFTERQIDQRWRDQVRTGQA